MPINNPIVCFKKYGVSDLSKQLQQKIDEGANPYEAARELIVAEHRRIHNTANEIRTIGKLKSTPYAEQKDISQELQKLKQPKPAETTQPEAASASQSKESEKDKPDVFEVIDQDRELDMGDEKVVKSRVKRIAKSLNVDEQISQRIHDIALKAKDYEDFKRQVSDLMGDSKVNENRIAEQYDDIREEAKSEYEKELERNLEDLRAAYGEAQRADTGLKKIVEKIPTSVRNFINRILNGTTPETVAAAKARLVEMQRKYRKEKAEMRAILPRERGVNFVIEKLSKAARNGDITQEGADLAIDLIRKQPNLFEDLAISITKGNKELNGDGVQGWYRAADALVKIFKNPKDPLTATHELLHHTERFLPQDVRDGITKEWHKQIRIQAADIVKKLKTETNVDKRQQLTQGLLYLSLAEARQTEPNAANVEAMERIMSKYLGDHTDSKGNFHKGLGDTWYQLYNPSEWWAVNASKIFRDAQNKPELKTWVDKAKAFYNYLIDSAKKIFKGNPTANVEKGLRTILKGEALEDREGTMLSQSKRLLNIKQKGSFEDRLKSIYDEVNKAKTPTQEPLGETAAETTQPEAATPEVAEPVAEEVVTETVAEQPPIPPAEPPTEPVTEESGDTGGKKKSTLNRLYEAKNMPERARAAFEKEGLEYVPASQEEAAAVAAATVDELGIDEAINLAAAGTFDGGVNAMIFGEVLNRLADNESDAGKWAEVAIQWDKYNRVRGQDISAINFFYKHSPLGVVLKENADRKKQFDEWAKGKNQSWEEYFEDLKSNPEFAKVLDKKIQEDLKKERQSSRAKRLASVRGAFAKAKEKFRKEGGGTYAIIIPPHVIETVLEAMELAYESGEAVVKIVDDAIKSISQKIGTDNWDKEKFRKEWEAELSEKGGKAPLTDEELKAKVLDKFRKKLKGLTEKEKDEVIRKAYKKIIESGGLDYDEFKEIIARVTGRGEMTDEQKAKLKEMVAKTNAAGEAAKVAQTERTPESLEKFYAAEIEAGRAARDLRDIFRQKPDIIRRLTSIMQLSTLGAVSLVANVTYNIWNQLALRYPIGLINDTIDRIWGGIGRMMGKPSVQEYNVWEAQGAFWNKMGQGVKESFEQIGSGLNRQDYTQKELYGQQMRPFKAWRELMAYAKGKRPLTRTEWWDKLIEGTAGIPAEIVARFLNVGDKPLRFGAQGAQAKAFTKALGLKDIDEKLFIEFPKEEAYRYYKGQGLSDEAAQQKADYVAEAIRKEGERATLQQDNLLNDAITRAAGVLPGGKDSGLASAAKMFVISPYIKIPTNAFWSYYNLVNPEVAIMQSLTYAGLAKKSKNKGDITKSQLLNREARYWMAHAMLGMGLRAVVIAMVQAGMVTPPPDDEESKKERDAMAFFDKPGTIQIGDTKIQTKWFGQLGALSNSIARKYFDATPEHRQNQDEFWNVVWGGMELEALKELENGIFANSSSLFQSISSGDFSRYGINTLNLLANIVQPATIAQLNRAALDEVPTSKGDSFLDKLNQNFAQRSTLYRRIFDVDIYKKQDIFGRPIPKGGNLLSRMFGVSKANPELELRELYDDYLRTGDSGFLPSAMPTKIGETKLNMKQQQKLAEYIGEERLRKLRPYVAGVSKIPIIEKPYADLTDEKKKQVVQSIYESGRLKGLEKFYKDYPEFKKAELSPEEQVEKKLLDVGKKIINQ